MKAMIFAAGFGKRLLPMTENTPKALVKVRNRPLLDWIIEYITQYGIAEIIVNTHYLHNEIVSFLARRQYSVPVKTSHENHILGTGGGLHKTSDFWDANDFLVCNVDSLCNADLFCFGDHHRDKNCLASLMVNDRTSRSRLIVDEEGYLVGRQKDGKREILASPKGKTKEVHFCGYHLISPQIFSTMKAPVAFSIIDHYLGLLKEGIRISTWHIENAYWESVESRKELNLANREFPGFSLAPSP